MEVTERAFAAQMEWLEQNREVVALPTALAQWDEPGSAHQVVLTFDDGYLDTYTTAFPLLQRLGYPFTIYLATESVETGIALGPSPQADPLTWDMAEEMLDSGLVTVGSHTHTHLDLRSAAPDVVISELETSDDLILRRLGVRSEHFAYPWGYWSASAHSAVAERYESAVVGGSARPPAAPEPHTIHRYPVQLSDSPAFFRSRLDGGMRLEEWTRRRLSGYQGP